MGLQGDVGEPGPQGDTGAQGPQGAPGPQGEPGLSGFIVRHSTVELNTVGTAPANASMVCEEGEIATGGGVKGATDVLVHASYPRTNGLAWNVTVSRNTDTTGPFHVEVYATCVTQPTLPN